MGIDRLMTPAEKTGVGDAVKMAKHKQAVTNDNLSSLYHDAVKVIASNKPEHRTTAVAIMAKCLATIGLGRQTLLMLAKQNEKKQRHH